jgi:RNA polymerase sigma-70 factor (ECF subfamily)
LRDTLGRFSPLLSNAVSDSQQNSTRNRAFVEMYARCQDRIYAYVVTLAPQWADADEIFQRTTIVLWEKWEEFDSSRDFVAWACGVARLEGLKYFSSSGREKRTLSATVMEQIAADYSEHVDALDARVVALEKCLKKLGGEQRQLLEQCYLGHDKIRDIAASLQLSANALYLKLRRIRSTLHECIDRNVTREGLS